MQVRFLTNASWRGRSIRKGEVLEMDDASARAYIAVDQAVAVEAIADDPSDEVTDKPSRRRRAAKIEHADDDE